MSLNIEGIHRVIQYFYDPPVKNDDPDQSPIWCLGENYSSQCNGGGDGNYNNNNNNDDHNGLESSIETLTKPQADEISVETVEDDKILVHEGKTEPQTIDEAGWPLPFINDVDSRIWMTYRNGFTAIPRSSTNKANLSFTARIRNMADQVGFTSDTGWGCMIRSGQCVLANALSSVELGRDWRRGSPAGDERAILSLFADDPRAPFSIHNFVKHGELACGVHPGEWFGPSATARCIQALTNDKNIGLKVYISGDGGDVYQDSFQNIAMPDGHNFTPTLVLVGIRLGIERITPVYWEALKSCLTMPQSVGIAGGRPSSSHYFIGVQGSNLFYLDPHTTRPFLPYHSSLPEYTPQEIESCHTKRLRRIHLREMDPSMLLAFLIKDENDWNDWRQRIKEIQGKPIVHIADHQPGTGLGSGPREGAVDDVEAFGDTEDEEEEEQEVVKNRNEGKTKDEEEEAAETRLAASEGEMISIPTLDRPA